MIKRNKNPVESVKELVAKAQAWDAMQKSCEENPTKTRKWIASLMRKNLEKAKKTS